MDRGAWQTTVHRFVKSWTQLKQLSMPSKLVIHHSKTNYPRQFGWKQQQIFMTA